MLPLTFGTMDHAPLVLCIGAHCDDIEIGCGATLLRWVREYPAARFFYVVFAGEPIREQESRVAAAQLLDGAAELDLRFFKFRASYFPSEVEAIKDAFESLKSTLNPDVIYTHHLNDRHQDHKLIGELTWNTFRSHTIFEYEIPKYEGDLGHPNIFVPIAAHDLEHKVRCLLASFPSQRSRSWFTGETFRAVARLRGIECGAPGGYAEAFHGRKLCL